jgi:hypothetical protein
MGFLTLNLDFCHEFLAKHSSNLKYRRVGAVPPPATVLGFQVAYFQVVPFGSITRMSHSYLLARLHARIIECSLNAAYIRLTRLGNQLLRLITAHPPHNFHLNGSHNTFQCSGNFSLHSYCTKRSVVPLSLGMYRFLH